MKIREEFEVRRDGRRKHVIVMPGRGGAADMTRIVSLNPSSMYLWEKLRGREFTAADAALLLTERYGSTPTRPGRMPGGGSRASPNAESWKSR